MKVFYILQMKDFCIMLSCGILTGIIRGIMDGTTGFLKNKVFITIKDTTFTTIATIFFIYIINMINYGEIRALLLIGYILGIILERITFGKLFAKGYKCVYNIIVRIFGKFKNSRIGKVVLK